jgi:hypothetical protein
MDLNVLRSIVTVAAFVLFVAILASASSTQTACWPKA